VHGLGRKTPTSTSQLLDITTIFASREEDVGAIFTDGKAKRKQKDEATEASGSRDPKKKKKGQKGSRVSRTTTLSPWRIARMLSDPLRNMASSTKC
jgi:hypothetical protein